LLLAQLAIGEEATQAVEAAAETEKKTEEPTGLYALTAIDIDGNNVSLSQYMGKVAMVVNTASHCKHTDMNYKALQAAYERYGPYGFVVLAFPCNQFQQQESRPEAVIKQFAQETYNVTFPMFSKVDVKGENMSDIFAFLRDNLPLEEFGGARQEITWNWHKWLVNRKGMPVKRYLMHYEAGIIEKELYKELTGHYFGEEPKKKKKKKRAKTAAVAGPKDSWKDQGKMAAGVDGSESVESSKAAAAESAAKDAVSKDEL